MGLTGGTTPNQAYWTPKLITLLPPLHLHPRHKLALYEFQRSARKKEEAGEVKRWRKENMSLSKLQEMVKDREAWCSAVRGVTKSWTRLSDYNNNLMSMCQAFICKQWSMIVDLLAKKWHGCRLALGASVWFPIILVVKNPTASVYDTEVVTLWCSVI